MASLLLLKRRIKTTKNVSKTTKAMQMIAASKLKKAQSAALFSKPYVEKLDSLSKRLASRLDTDNLNQYMIKPNNTNIKLFIVISPDKGLCGGLVTNLIKEVVSTDDKLKNVYITVGKKAESYVSALNKEIIASFPFGTTLPVFDTVFPIANLVNEYFLSKKVSEVVIVTTKFTNVFTQSPQISTLLPVSLHEDHISKDSPMLFEPSTDYLLPDLLKHYIEMIIFQNLLENYASEQAARMIAMKNATDNALDIISDLELMYNKSRQERITNELLDITGGMQTLYE